MMEPKATVPDQAVESSAFSLKAVLFGLLGAVLVAGVSMFVADHLKQGDWVVCHLSMGACFYLLVLCLVWNPLLGRWIPALRLQPRELAVIMGLSLIGSSFAYVGVVRQLQAQLILPHVNLANQPQWQKYGLLDYLPAKLFPNRGVVDDTIHNGFKTGLGYRNEWIAFDRVPWVAWLRVLVLWGPLVVMVGAAVMALALVVHRQWVYHEQLSYPLATVMESLYRKRDTRAILADVFHSRLFWWAFGFVFFIHSYNCLQAWFPAHLNAIPLQWEMAGLERLFPSLAKTNCLWVGRSWLYFSVVGIAYFVSSSLGLTMGLNYILYAVFAAQIYYLTGAAPTWTDTGMSNAGAYVVYAVMLAWLGRHFYGPVFLKALGRGTPTDRERESVQAARIFMAAAAGMVMVLCIMGLSLTMAVLFTLTLLILFLVFTRIVCEGGVPHLQAGWMPATLICKIFGAAAVGPAALTFISLLSGIMTLDNRQCLMPYAATGFKLADDERVSRLSFLKLGGIAVVAAFAVALIAGLWQYYSFGAVENDWMMRDGWKVGLRDAVREISQLDDTGQLHAAAAAHGLERLRMIRPDPAAMTYLAVGAGGVLLFSLLRYRLAWWPLHPMLFCVWGCWPAIIMWASFLIGWSIKALVVKFGGDRVYRQLKPFFIGLIFGEIGAAGVIKLISIGYYFRTGRVPHAVYNAFFGG